MDFEEALTMELKTISQVENRVYPLTAPEKTKIPYIVYTSPDALRVNTVTNGYLPDKTVEGEINIIAARYSTMKQITSQVIDMLVGMSRREIGTGGPYISEMIYEKPVELYEAQVNLYRCLIDYKAHFKE